jgi:hypothetical protein
MQCLPPEMTAEVERVTLSAVRDLLADQSNRPPAHLAEEQYEELSRVRAAAIRSVHATVDGRITSRRRIDLATRAVGDWQEARRRFDSLRKAAETLRLKGNEAAIITAIIDGGGRVPLKDLGVTLQWGAPFGEWNAARDRLNKKLKKFGWRLRTHDRDAVAEPTKPTARK